MQPEIAGRTMPAWLDSSAVPRNPPAELAKLCCADQRYPTGGDRPAEDMAAMTGAIETERASREAFAPGSAGEQGYESPESQPREDFNLGRLTEINPRSRDATPSTNRGSRKHKTREQQRKALRPTSPAM